MKILLLVSAFNGLTQRTWIELRRAGHEVIVELASSDAVMLEALRSTRPDLVLCPYLRDSTAPGRLPAEVWQTQPTVVLHLGPIGSLGPDPIDWAIIEGARSWGVTALQATTPAQPATSPADTGTWAVWSTHEFTVPYGVRSRSALHDGPVTDAAMAVVHDVVAKVAGTLGHRPRRFVPVPLAAFTDQERHGRPRPAVPRSARQLDWHRDSSDDVLRKVAAADGSPGAECRVGGERLLAFDAQPSSGEVATRGVLRARRDGPVLLPTADGAVWIGHLARPGSLKLPARLVLAHHPRLVEDWPPDADTNPADTGAWQVRDIRYRRFGPVGWIDVDFYNGAMSTDHCRRLLAAFTWARRQDTKVIVLRGGDSVFSHGIHLNLIEVSGEPTATGWLNIEALNDLCEAFITTTDQLLVAGVSGNAGAGGAMMALGADVVAARSGIVLNPHYAATGLFGSEFWTYTLPRRVGSDLAAELTTAGLPIGATEAQQIGMVDDILPRDLVRYDEALHEIAAKLAGPGWQRAVAAKSRRRETDERSVPLAVYRARERERLAADLFDDDTHVGLLHELATKSAPALPPRRIAARRSTDPQQRITVPPGRSATWASGVWDGSVQDQPGAGRTDRAER